MINKINNGFKIFSGNSNRPLAERITTRLEVNLARASVGRWTNGECRIQLEENVRGTDVFIIQSISWPANENLMELLLMIDAAKRASADRITAVIPYYGYSKQEKKVRGREPISAKLVANLIVAAGANRVLTVNLHAPAIQGFFDIPVDHLDALSILAAKTKKTINLDGCVVVAPDKGRVEMAVELSAKLGAGMAIVFKRHPLENREDVKEVEFVGADLDGRTAIILDDMVLSGGTLLNAVNRVASCGVKEIHACIVHGAFCGDCLSKIESSPLGKVVVTDTIAADETAAGGKLVIASVTDMLAEAIRRIHYNKSVSEMFE